jgi:hypothetical protein
VQAANLLVAENLVLAFAIHALLTGRTSGQAAVGTNPIRYDVTRATKEPCAHCALFRVIPRRALEQVDKNVLRHVLRDAHGSRERVRESEDVVPPAPIQLDERLLGARADALE